MTSLDIPKKELIPKNCDVKCTKFLSDELIDDLLDKLNETIQGQGEIHKIPYKDGSGLTKTKRYLWENTEGKKSRDNLKKNNDETSDLEPDNYYYFNKENIIQILEIFTNSESMSNNLIENFIQELDDKKGFFSLKMFSLKMFNRPYFDSSKQNYGRRLSVVFFTTLVLFIIYKMFAWSKSSPFVTRKKEPNLSENEIALKEKERGLLASMISATIFGIFNSSLDANVKVDPATSTALIGSIIGNMLGFMSDQVIARNDGLEIFQNNKKNAMGYMFATLATGNFFRFMITVFIDMGISMILFNKLFVYLIENVPPFNKGYNPIDNMFWNTTTKQWSRTAPNGWMANGLCSAGISMITIQAYANDFRLKYAYPSESTKNTSHWMNSTFPLIFAVISIILLYLSPESYNYEITPPNGLNLKNNRVVLILFVLFLCTIGVMLNVHNPNPIVKVKSVYCLPGDSQQICKEGHNDIFYSTNCKDNVKNESYLKVPDDVFQNKVLMKKDNSSTIADTGVELIDENNDKTIIATVYIDNCIGKGDKLSIPIKANKSCIVYCLANTSDTSDTPLTKNDLINSEDTIPLIIKPEQENGYNTYFLSIKNIDNTNSIYIFAKNSDTGDESIVTRIPISSNIYTNTSNVYGNQNSSVYQYYTEKVNYDQSEIYKYNEGCRRYYSDCNQDTAQSLYQNENKKVSGLILYIVLTMVCLFYTCYTSELSNKTLKYIIPSVIFICMFIAPFLFIWKTGKTVMGLITPVLVLCVGGMYKLFKLKNQSEDL